MVRLGTDTVRRILNILLVVMLVCIVSACGGNSTNEIQPSRPADTSESPPKEDVVITIGNLTDLTGASSNAIAVIDQALDDLVGYYNEENLIPGIRLEVVAYDGMLDSAQDILGYEWLLSKGADFIYTGVPPSAVTLSGRVNRDQIVLFTPSVPLEMLDPPGYVFNLGNVPEHDAFTLLDWIAKNDWDYKTNGPAKIGGAGWKDSYNVEFLDSLKKYAHVHPAQFDFIGGYATDFAFLWQTEIQGLKDADYVFPPSVPTSFITQYRKAGYDAKFICAETQAAFTDLISDAGLWDEIDGAIFVRVSQWWNETGLLIDFTNAILEEKHSPSRVEQIREKGSGYLSAGTSLRTMLEIVRNAVETVGPDAFYSQSLYEAAQSYSLVMDGIELLSFSEEKRYLSNYRRIYVADKTVDDLVVVTDGWIPVLTEP